MQRPKERVELKDAVVVHQNVCSPPAWPGVTAIIAAIPTSERLDVLFPTAHPPLLDLAVRIIVKLYPALRVVGPLVWVPARDRRSIEVCRHGLPHRVVARALLRAVGEVEDRLVQARGHLRRRRAWQSFFFFGE